MKYLFKPFQVVLNIFVLVGALTLFTMVIFMGGYSFGYIQATEKAQTEIEDYIANVSSANYGEQPSPQYAQATAVPQTPQQARISWSGPDLWSSVNARRVQLGVNPLSQRDELCTIASIRLNELLDAGKLDGHEGFSNLPERREDLRWIFEKYNNVSEFLVSGAQTANHAVELWENTLGHKKLLTGGEYVWGCIYAQESFGVAITAF